jgi:hypothetical protein
MYFPHPDSPHCHGAWRKPSLATGFSPGWTTPMMTWRILGK